MAIVDSSVMCLRFFGDDLDPDEITGLLGRKPTSSERKGDVRVGKVTGQRLIARQGGWRLQASDQSGSDLESQLAEILAGMTRDIRVWVDLTSRFEADIFCGLFMKETNEGLAASPQALLLLGERGLKLSLDIYSPTKGD